MIECIDIDNGQILGTFNVLNGASVKCIIAESVAGVRKLDVPKIGGVFKAVGRDLINK